MRTVFLLFLFSYLLCACSTSRRIHEAVQKTVLQDSVLQNAHVGISIYEPATGRWWYNWQGDKFFVPASNVKIPTCYAAMKYLGDSLVGIKYKRIGHVLAVKPSGDPTFLHPDFKFQPVAELLKKYGTEINVYNNNTIDDFGSGWSWNDYDQSYMVERNSFPVYGNVIWIADHPISSPASGYDTTKSFGSSRKWIRPKFFAEKLLFDSTSSMQRKQWENTFYLRTLSGSRQIPFLTNDNFTAVEIIKGLTGKKVTWGGTFVTGVTDTILHSQPTDSLLRPMMHRSDNFFAEQALLMVSNELLGYMSDEKIIDTLLKTDFADLPQKPRWVDGSGLSRYNLITPQDLVAILQKIKNEFGMDRIRDIFPSGGEGTLSNFYKADRPYLYAKTGTLSGVVALSGYLTTAKGKELIVSVLVNNHRSGAVQVRRVIERFLQNLRNQY